MATRLTKAVSREATTVKYGNLIITLTPAGLTTREKGRRTVYGTIPYDHLHERGAILKAKSNLAEKQAKRKVRRSNLRLKVGI